MAEPDDKPGPVPARASAAQQIVDAVMNAPVYEAPPRVGGDDDSEAPAGSSDSTVRRPRGPGQREVLIEIAKPCVLWHSEDREAFVSFPVDEHRETHPVRSKPFRDWLKGCAFRQHGLVAGGQAFEDVLGLLEARATTEGPRQAPWMRVGERDGRLYLDLCDARWRVVEIDPSGWRILDRHDLPFVRSKTMVEIPAPEAGGLIEELRRFINVESDDDFHLVVAWLVAAMRPRGPYPILTINGEQGSGKSVFTRLVRTLVDPNLSPLRSSPRDDRDLFVAAVNTHVMALDNISKIESWLSDGLCRLATGGGFAARTLHTDRDENVLIATRPLILNGIPMLTERPDLAERALTVRLTAIAEDRRQPEDEFWQDWGSVQARVVGALCDAVATGLRRIAGIRLDHYPRMADFTKWAVACEPGLGWDEGTFVQAYADNRRDTTETTFEADPVAVAVHAMMMQQPRDEPWRGTATDLLDRLAEHSSEATRRARAWPITAQGLGNRIDRIAPLLRGKGILVERKHSKVRTITLLWLH